MIDISIRNLTKAFEVTKNILDGLDLQVQHGERIGILGRNGAGKTTLFRLMVGELTEDRGISGKNKKMVQFYSAFYTADLEKSRACGGCERVFPGNGFEDV